MTTSSLKAPEGADLEAFPSGALSNLSELELQQSSRVRKVGELLDKNEAQWRIEVVNLKLLMDQNDPQINGGGHDGSRFWESARAGLHGERLQQMVENDSKNIVNRWLRWNAAAAELLGPAGTRVPATPDDPSSLPLALAQEQDISFRSLDAFASAPDDAKDSLRLLMEAEGTFSQRHCEYISRLHREFPDRVDELHHGIRQHEFKRPHAILDRMTEWEAQRREQEARDKALAEAAALAEAEQNEQAAQTYVPSVEPEEHIGDQPEAEDVAVRRSPSKAWYSSTSGKAKVEEVVGDLAKPLPDLIGSLSDLSMRLDDQFSHASTMHNYAEFWAGYDRFFYAESTARAKWGRGGRLERMKKLRTLLKEVAGKLDVYITGTTPPDGIEYPES
jgi:hypothetical protein